MKKALHFFKQTIKKNRLSHLYLISGPSGSGKVKLANEVSYLIINQNKPENKHLKQQIDAHQQANVLYIEPKGQVLKKEQIIQLQNEFSKTALVKGPRIYIINHVEKMNQQAANSLLKFMEEPISQEVYGFLLTDQIDMVIQTITSRSQMIQLTKVDELTLKEQLLKENIDEKLATLAPYITKDLNQAIQLTLDVNFIELVNFIEGIVKRFDDPNAILSIYIHKHAGIVLQDREIFLQFLELLLLYFLDLIHYRVNQPIVYQFLKEDIQRQSESMKVQKINMLIESIQKIIKRQTYFINLELALDELSYILEKKR